MTRYVILKSDEVVDMTSKPSAIINDHLYVKDNNRWYFVGEIRTELKSSNDLVTYINNFIKSLKDTIKKGER